MVSVGNLVKIGSKKLRDDIQKLPEDCTYKTSRMFELWLDTNPNATRRQVVDVLKKEVIKEITIAIAHEFELVILRKCCISTGE